MLTLPIAVRIYLARGATEMRKSIDGLSAVTRTVLDHNPVSGHLFVFCNARRDRIKILYWEVSARFTHPCASLCDHRRTSTINPCRACCSRFSA